MKIITDEKLIVEDLLQKFKLCNSGTLLYEDRLIRKPSFIDKLTQNHKERKYTIYVFDRKIEIFCKPEFLAEVKKIANYLEQKYETFDDFVEIYINLEGTSKI